MSKSSASASAFTKAFTIPAIPETIRGQKEVTLNSTYQSILNSWTSPTLKGKALLFAITQQAFGGATCTAVRPRTRYAWIAACNSAPLPTCKGGKDARPLQAAEVKAFLLAFETAYNGLDLENPEAPEAPEAQQKTL